jgi:hypothetical protein
MKQPYRTAAKRQEAEVAARPLDHLGVVPFVVWVASVVRCIAAWRQDDVSGSEPVLAAALAIVLAPAAARAVKRTLGRDSRGRAR